MNINFYIRNIYKQSNMDKIIKISQDYKDYPIVFDLKLINMDLISQIFNNKHNNLGVITDTSYISNFADVISKNVKDIKIAVIDDIDVSERIYKALSNKLGRIYMNTYINIEKDGNMKNIIDYYNRENPIIPVIGYLPSNVNINNINTFVSRIESISDMQRIKLGIVTYPFALNPGNMFYMNPYKRFIIVIEEDENGELRFISYTVRTSYTLDRIQEEVKEEIDLNNITTFDNIEDCINNVKLFKDIVPNCISTIFRDIDHKDLESNEKYHENMKNILQKCSHF